MLNSPWIHRPEGSWHCEGWMIILTTNLMSSTDHPHTDLEPFIKALKSKSIQLTLPFLQNLINSAGSVNRGNLAILFSRFPPSSVPPEPISYPFSSSASLSRAAALSNNPSRLEIMRVPLDAGLDPNWTCAARPKRKPTSLTDIDQLIEEAYGKTEWEAALHVAAEEGDVDMVSLLLDRGANKGLTGGLGRTVEDRARKKGRKEVRGLGAYLVGDGQDRLVTFFTRSRDDVHILYPFQNA